MFRVLLALMLFASCSGAKGGPSMNNSMTSAEPTPQTSDVISSDILAREPLANSAMVKHILIGWNQGGGEQHDQRAQKRTKKDAEDQVRALMTQIKGGADFDALMKQWSEDPGSAGSGRAYAVAPDAQLVIEFKQLGLRLRVGEVGVVQSDYGFHIMKRTE
jgi:hypothetical protein